MGILLTLGMTTLVIVGRIFIRLPVVTSIFPGIMIQQEAELQETSGLMVLHSIQGNTTSRLVIGII